MVVPAHLGVEHPSLLWLVAVGILAFVAGLGVNLHLRRRERKSPRQRGNRRIPHFCPVTGV